MLKITYIGIIYHLTVFVKGENLSRVLYKPNLSNAVDFLVFHGCYSLKYPILMTFYHIN